MSFKYKKLNSKLNVISVFLLLLILSCNLQPLYKTSNISKSLCDIKISDTKAESTHYEEIFKNKMQNTLCSLPQNSAKYLLLWEIAKNKEELIGSGDNKIIRYQMKLSVKYELIDIINNNTLYKDEVYSNAEYNVLEDEMVSTIASEKFSESIIAKNLTSIIIDKIYLFMANNENSKL